MTLKPWREVAVPHPGVSPGHRRHAPAATTHAIAWLRAPFL